MDIPQQWQIHPEQWQADSAVASVRYRRLPDGGVQVYWVDPKVEMTETDAASVATTAEAAILREQGDLGIRQIP